MSNEVINPIVKKALLVNLRLGVPGNARMSIALTSEANSKLGMDAKSGRYSKYRFPDEALKPLTQIQNAARVYHYSRTLPWSTEGLFILPTALHWEYMSKIGQFRDKFNGLVESHFLARYQDWVDWAKQHHNGNFTISDYPGTSYERRKFRFEVDCIPVPSGSDFRIEMGDETLAEMKAQTDLRVTEALESAKNDLWERLKTPLERLHSKLQDKDAQFKNSLVGNVLEIVGLIESLNVMGDSNITKTGDAIKSMMKGVNADTLRVNESYRKETSDKAAKILSDMQGYF